MDWTVVRHKRGSAAGRSSAARALHLPSNKSSLASHTGFYTSTLPESQKLSREPAAKADDFEASSGRSEEDRLLGQMQRAVAKVEQSVFFRRFMKQLQDLEVMENLQRSRVKLVANQKDLNEAGDDASGADSDENVDAEWRGSTVELLVYGVGSIANSEISRCQLSLALLLRRRLAAVRGILVYDPILSPSERSVMLNLGCSPLDDNDEGRRPLNGPTLYYMPHCDVELYESVLQANLKPGSIDQLVILGNSFRTYQERWSVSPLPQGERPSCLLKVQTSVDEIPVADNFSPTAFNDTSWHFFSNAEVSKLC